MPKNGQKCCFPLAPWYTIPTVARGGVAFDQSDRAYQAIREDIARGRYQPGQRLVEAEIAQRAGVSRTPVRQALRWLERDGVVRIEKRRGATMRELSAQQIADLYELRAQLEAFASRLAARRADDEDRAELRRLAREFEVAACDDESQDLAAVRAANASLHRKITDAANNPFLGMALDTIVEHPLVLRAFQRFGRGELDRSALFHQLIVDSICKGEAERAGRLMAEHVLQARDALVDAYDRVQEAGAS
jgi:DNA-binding GntR family transcriptional regulator